MLSLTQMRLNNGSLSKTLKLFAASLIVAGCSQNTGSWSEVSRLDTSHLQDLGYAAVQGRGQSESATGTADIMPLIDGKEAFDVWLDTLSSAERSIDLKTFIFSNDEAGEIVAAELIRASNRGVQVRLLVDDFFHYWGGTNLSVLDQYDGITVRVFNPINRVLPPPFNYLLTFDQANARMHNKVLVVDDASAIIGGRNVGDEYFHMNTSDYFADFDVLVKGAPVEHLKQSFDVFWGDRLAVPYSRFARTNPRRNETPEARDFAQNVAQLLQNPRDNDRHRQSSRSFRAEVVSKVDAPDKLRASATEREYVVADAVIRSIAGAEREVVIVTPYFIPEKYGAEMLEGLVRRGVDVHVFTNSLGSTNHPSVHAGYLRYRNRLLKAGVRIYEHRENMAAAFEDGQIRHLPKINMHTKLTLIDGRYAVVGSPNFDPRSLRKNTESVLLLDSPELADWLLTEVRQTIRHTAYELRLDEDSSVVWAYLKDRVEAVRKSEPGGGFSDILVSTFFTIIPMDSNL